MVFLRTIHGCRLDHRMFIMNRANYKPCYEIWRNQMRHRMSLFFIFFLFVAVICFVGCAATGSSKIPLWHGKDIRTINDQATLIVIAKNLYSFENAIFALEKLEDQNVLAEVAMEANNQSIRIAALERLTDQNLLSDIATKNDKPDVRCAAVKNENLNNHALLLKIAESDDSYEVRTAASKRLMDYSWLNKVISDRKALFTALSEYANFSDLEERYYMIDEDDSNRKSTEKYGIENERYTLWRYQYILAQTLDDQSLLEKLSLHGDCWLVRLMACSKVTNQNLLAEISQSDEDEYVRLVSSTMLESQPAFEYLTGQYSESDLRFGKAILKMLPELCRIQPQYVERISRGFLKALKLVNCDAVFPITGNVETTETSWREISQYYSIYGMSPSPVYGEDVTLTIKVEKLKDSLTVHWWTVFKHELVSAQFFIEADINGGDILKLIWQQLPYSSKRYLAMEYPDEDVRIVAIDLIDDPEILSKIAEEAKSNDIRSMASEKLKDISGEK